MGDSKRKKTGFAEIAGRAAEILGGQWWESRPGEKKAGPLEAFRAARKDAKEAEDGLGSFQKGLAEELAASLGESERRQLEMFSEWAGQNAKKIEKILLGKGRWERCVEEILLREDPAIRGAELECWAEETGFPEMGKLRGIKAPRPKPGS